MKTLNEILDNYKDYAVVLDDRFGSRLAKFLTEEQLEKIGFKYDGDEPYPEPKESSILKAISDAIEEYEENQQRRIDLLESKILLFEREREAFIRHLREGNIQLLKDYLGIKDE